MYSYPINIFADTVTFTLCCLGTNANKASIPVLIKSVYIFYNMILIKMMLQTSLKVWGIYYYLGRN